MSSAKRFTPEHEYVVYDSDSKIGRMSITDYAQKSLGDVVFVELPAVGSEFGKGGMFLVILNADHFPLSPFRFTEV